MRTICKPFIIIVFAVVNLTAYCQSFITELCTDTDERYISGIEDPEGNYIISIIRGIYTINDPALIEYNSIIYKISSNGALIDSLEFPDNDTLCYSGIQLFKTQDELICYSIVYHKNDLYNRLAVRLVRMSYDLEIINDNIYFMPGYYLTPGNQACLNESGNLLLGVAPQNILTNEWYAAALELTTDGNFVKEVATDSLLPLGTIIPLSGNNGYIFSDICTVVLLDNDLHFVKQLYVPQSIESHIRILYSFKALDDSSLIITGCVDEVPQHWWDPPRDDAAWAILDKNGQWLSQNAIGLYGYNDYAVSVDFITPDNIYIIRRNTDSDLQRFCLFDFKADGSENWHQCYTYNGYELLGGSVLATSDSTCLLVCSYQTENSGYNEYDLVVMKLNRDGTITGNDKPEEAPVNVTVYPNPGESNISISGKVSGCLFSLYDNTGRLVVLKKLVTNHETIDTASLPASFYTYRVTGSGSVVTTGKWVKL